MDLPQYVSEPLGRSPLVLVAAQVNFEAIGQDVSHDQARQIQKLVGAEWVQLQPAQRVTANITPGGVMNEPNRQAYRLLTRDGTWAALLSPDSVTIETRAYVDWSYMCAKFEVLTRAVGAVFDPACEQRLGLRFINQIQLPDDQNGWEGLIPGELLGVALDVRFRDHVLASDQKVLLQVDSHTRCLFRHGLLDDGNARRGGVYLLDYDVYRENQPTYDPDSIAAAADVLHGHVGSLFRACLTKKLYTWLRG